jgi:hypothetical protein
MHTKVIEGKPEGNSPFLRHRNLWKDNIKMDSTGWEDVVLIHLTIQGGLAVML